MKKIISALLVLMLAFCLCACSSINDRASDEESESPSQTEESAPVETPEATPEVSVSPSVSADDEAGLAGTIAGDQYINKAMGFSVTIPEGWMFASDEEIEALYGQTKDLLEGTVELPENSQGYLMVCSQYPMGTSGYNPNINMTVTNTTLTAAMYDAMLEQFQTMYTQMYVEQMGADSVEVTGSPSVTFGGKDYMNFNIVSTFGSDTMYQTQYMTMTGDYLLTATYTCYDAEELSVMDTFMEGMQYAS